jgi:NADH-quinone oxidoreductase subunit J
LIQAKYLWNKEMTLEFILFCVFSAGGVSSALLVIIQRNPIYSALYLILNFFCLAGLYLTLHAQFIAVIQILVYAGAIMVLFVFVIMLLNLGDENGLRDAFTWKKVFAGGLGFGVLMELIYVFLMQLGTPSIDAARATNIGTVEAVGHAIFTRLLFPFEVTSLLLTAAVVGAIVLAKKKID